MGARPIVRDDFRGVEAPGRRPTRGEWKIADGIARATQDDELFRKNKNHGPALWYDATFTDAIIQFMYRPDGCRTFVVTVNDAAGHVFRTYTSASGTDVRGFPAADATHKARRLADGGPGLKQKQWTRIRVELRGRRVIVSIGDSYQKIVEMPSLERKKTTVGLSFTFGSVEIKEFEIFALEGAPAPVR